jgi:two-component system, LuxR family, response regulator FixJ
MNIGIGTVFIIDDDAILCRSLERLLRSAGLVAESYTNPRDFLNRLPHEGVGCILLDRAMSGMTGPELQDQMMAMDFSLPIVYLTGHADVPMTIRAMKSGAFDILLKPVDDERLLAVVRAALHKHASLTALAHERVEIMNRLSCLSLRERDVMERVIGGLLNKQIAAELGIAEKTVKVHRARVMQKLQLRAHSVVALVRLCQLVGIVPHRSPVWHWAADFAGGIAGNSRGMKAKPSHRMPECEK